MNFVAMEYTRKIGIRYSKTKKTKSFDFAKALFENLTLNNGRHDFI